MGGKTQRGWIVSTVKRKGRAVLGIGIPARSLRKTYTLPIPPLLRRVVSPKVVLA